MRTTRIFTRIFLSNAIIGLISVITISIIFYFLIRSALVERTLDQLNSVNTLKEEQIDTYFIQLEKDLKFLLTVDHEREFDSIRSTFDFKEIKIIDGSFDRFTYVDSSEDGHTKLLYILPIGNKKCVVVEENFRKVEKLLLENAGMGSTGESYLVGPDNKLRSASRFFPERPPLTIQLDDEPTGPDHIRTDYRGTKVISFARPLINPSLKWKIVSEIDFSEAMEPVVKFRNYLAILTIILAMLIVVVSVFISNAISRPILYLEQVIKQLALGNLPPKPVVVNTTDEIGKVAQAVNALVEREIKLVRDRTAALLEGQENERKRITLELHDGVGQLLTAVRLRVEATHLDIGERKEIMALLNEIIAEVKRISYNVMPGSLVDFGLEAALKGLCDNTARYSKLKFEFRYVRDSDHTLSFDVTVAVFRIVQEGINNILKHASATHVDLNILDKEDEIYLLLKDNGKGFNPAAPEHVGLGLRSMSERAKLLGGSVDIHSEPNEGTTVEARIPLPIEIRS